MSFNLVIVGDKGVGKTCLIKRHTTGHFVEEYTQTHNTTCNTLSFNNGDKCASFNVYEGGHPDKVDGAIIMFDVCNKESFDNVINHHKWLMETFNNPTLPIILCGNKVDLFGKRISKYAISKFINETHKHLNFTFFYTSSKSNYNYEKPFMILLNKLM